MSKDKKESSQEQEEIIPETLGVNVSDDVKVDDVSLDSAPVIEVEEIKSSDPGSKKVRVKFLKDLYPRVKICGDWIEARKGDEKFLTVQQARILRNDDTVM